MAKAKQKVVENQVNNVQRPRRSIRSVPCTSPDSNFVVTEKGIKKSSFPVNLLKTIKSRSGECVSSNKVDSKSKSKLNSKEKVEESSVNVSKSQVIQFKRNSRRIKSVEDSPIANKRKSDVKIKKTTIDINEALQTSSNEQEENSVGKNKIESIENVSESLVNPIKRISRSNPKSVKETPIVNQKRNKIEDKAKTDKIDETVITSTNKFLENTDVKEKIIEPCEYVSSNPIKRNSRNNLKSVEEKRPTVNQRKSFRKTDIQNKCTTVENKETPKASTNELSENSNSIKKVIEPCENVSKSLAIPTKRNSRNNLKSIEEKRPTGNQRKLQVKNKVNTDEINEPVFKNAIEDLIPTSNSKSDEHITVHNESSSCINDSNTILNTSKSHIKTSIDILNKDVKEISFDDSSEEEPLAILFSKKIKKCKNRILSDEENVDNFEVATKSTRKAKRSSKTPNDIDESFLLSEEEKELEKSIRKATKRKFDKEISSTKQEGYKSSKRTFRLSKSNKKIVDSSDSDSYTKEEKVTKQHKKANRKVIHGKRGRKKTEIGNLVDLYVSQTFLKENVTCQICKVEMSDKKYKTEHKKQHNYLCWSDKEPPMDFYNNEFVILLFKSVPPPYICESCGDVKRSSPGFYAHFLLCGRSAEEKAKAYIYCEICDQNFLIPYYSLHLHRHAQYRQENVDDTMTKAENNEDLNTSTKRSAARKAVTKISQITSDIVEEDIDEKKKKRKPKEDEEFTLMEDDDGFLGEEEEDENDSELEDSIKEVESCEEDLAEVLPYDDDRMRNLAATFFRTVNDMTYGYERLKYLYSASPLHEKLIAAPFQWLKEFEVEQYLPSTKESVTFNIGKGESQVLSLFSSHKTEENFVLFCGGPVWAMAWMPFPSEAQYLALATHKEMDSTHKKNVAEMYKSVIQIWKFPQMSCVKNHQDSASPTMVFCIAHEEGAIWALEWCPSGAVIPGHRMGLLAAACSSGRILLYAVPDLETLEMDCSKKSCVSNLQPVLKMQIEEDITSPCLRLSWNKASPHDLLFAGYGDGYVAVFDISSSADTVCCDNIMLPISMFQAHMGEVMAVSMGYYPNNQILFTAGIDRHAKIWDLSDVSTPLQVVKPGVNMMKRPLLGALVPFLPLFGLTYDVSQGSEQSNFCPFLIRDFAYVKDATRMVLPQTNPHFSLSFSPICNLHLTGNEKGTLFSTYYGDTTFMTRTNKSNEVAKIILDTKFLKQTEDIENSSTYKAAAAKFHLSFSHLKKDYKVATREEFEDYDLANILSVQWNCNVNCLLYLAAGLKCGLVHVINSHMINSYYLKRFYNNIKE